MTPANDLIADRLADGSDTSRRRNIGLRDQKNRTLHLFAIRQPVANQPQPAFACQKMGKNGLPYPMSHRLDLA